MISVRNLTVSIGARSIVRDLNLTAQVGEVTVIVGPNGSGKTTLLRAISGDLGYRGSITINGRDLASLCPVEQAALRAVLPQSTSLSFPFNVREIVGLGIVAGLNRGGEPGQIVDRALAKVDLAGFAGRFYQELSGGEQQRVQLARVLCQVWQPVLEGRPRWLFLDEPVSSLDIRHQLAILDIARDYAAAGGGVIAILHDLNLAAMYGDAILAMRDGAVRANGAPVDVITRDLIRDVFQCDLIVQHHAESGTPYVMLPGRASPVA